MDNYSPELLLWYPLHKEITPKPCYTSKISIRYSKSVLFRMYVYVVRTCIWCGTNVYLGGTKMGGTKRRWYEKPGYRFVISLYLFCNKHFGFRAYSTSREIQKLAKNGLVVHASIVWRSCKEQGWTLQQTRYCQLIREANKVKRLELAQRILDSGDTFDNAIFSKECSIYTALLGRLAVATVVNWHMIVSIGWVPSIP